MLEAPLNDREKLAEVAATYGLSRIEFAMRINQLLDELQVGMPHSHMSDDEIDEALGSCDTFYFRLDNQELFALPSYAGDKFRFWTCIQLDSGAMFIDGRVSDEVVIDYYFLEPKTPTVIELEHGPKIISYWEDALEYHLEDGVEPARVLN